jgi:hypothetical protein
MLRVFNPGRHTVVTLKKTPLSVEMRAESRIQEISDELRKMEDELHELNEALSGNERGIKLTLIRTVRGGGNGHLVVGGDIVSDSNSVCDCRRLRERIVVGTRVAFRGAFGPHESWSNQPGAIATGQRSEPGCAGDRKGFRQRSPRLHGKRRIACTSAT